MGGFSYTKRYEYECNCVLYKYKTEHVTGETTDIIIITEGETMYGPEQKWLF